MALPLLVTMRVNLNMVSTTEKTTKVYMKEDMLAMSPHLIQLVQLNVGHRSHTSQKVNITDETLRGATKIMVTLLVRNRYQRMLQLIFSYLLRF